MPAARKPSVSQIAAVIGRGGRSKLYLWMWDNYTAIKNARVGRADWIGATEEFIKLGYTGRNGIPLTPENVRKTWSRVEKDRKAEDTPPPPNRLPHQERLNASPAQAVTQAVPDQTEHVGKLIAPGIPKTAPRYSFAVSTPKKEI